MNSYIAVDLAKVYNTPTKGDDRKLLTTLAWGDEVELIKKTDSSVHIRLKRFQRQSDGSIKPVMTDGYIVPSKSGGIKTDELLQATNDVLKVDFVDVQQGDGSVIETPSGKLMLIDGGDNQLFARYLAGRFMGSSTQAPKNVECILVTHGDADHFSGLTEIYKSESSQQTKAWKKLFMSVERIYHNGIVKRPGTVNKKKVPDIKLLGKTNKDTDGHIYVTDLVDDLTKVDDTEMNTPFREWKKAVNHYKKRNNSLILRRLDHKTNPADAFDFLDAGIEVEILGPISEKVSSKTGLKFLAKPPKLPGTKQLGSKPASDSSLSASHTINGHSVILKIRYGSVTFLFSGDLNEEAEDILVKKNEADPSVLRADVFKVPHHGSADFSNKFIEAVKPVVSVVSSGDESELKEYIHPRATLMGALGKHSRIDRPLIFVTELVAFFKREGYARVTEKAKKNAKLEDLREIYAFSRTAFGIVKVRTNGKRLLVYTNSGQDDLKEAYVFDMTANPPKRLEPAMV